LSTAAPRKEREKSGTAHSVLLIFPFHGIIAPLRKLLFIVVLLPIFSALGWWYFREQKMPDYGPDFREYAYVTNGKSNTVSVIDLRYFRLAKTLHVGSEPTGVAANSTKNEI
jgi:YVTN family beta-propeller protein